MRFKHPHPLKDFDYLGRHHYALTWGCEDRKPLFTQADRVELVRAQILRAAAETNFEIIAYCFMPDHLHQLVKGCSDSADARRYIKLAKQYSGYYFSKAFGEKVFQRYGYERWLRQDDDPRALIGYIIQNPVAAGIAEAPEQYPFTGSQVHTVQDLLKLAL